MKKWYGSKTMWFSIALACLGVLQNFDWLTFLSKDNAGLVLLVIGLLSAGLRIFTTEALKKPEIKGPNEYGNRKEDY